MEDPRMLNSDLSRMKWFASADEFPADLYQQYLQTLARIPHRVDILVQAGELSEEAASDLLARLSRHPKVGTVILYKLAPEHHVVLAAEAAMLGATLRFCDSEEEKHVLLSKRRSQVIEMSDAKVPDLYKNLNERPYEPYARPPFTQ